MFNPVRSFQNLTNMNQIAISRACWDEESTACTSLAVDSCWLTATLPCYFCHLNLHTCHTSDISYFSSSAAWQQDLGTHPAPPRSAKRRWLLAFKSWEWLLCLLRPNGIAGLFQWSICICWMCVCVCDCVCMCPMNESKPSVWRQKKGLKAFRFKRNQLHYISLYTGIRLPVLKFLAVSENATVKKFHCVKNYLVSATSWSSGCVRKFISHGLARLVWSEMIRSCTVWRVLSQGLHLMEGWHPRLRAETLLIVKPICRKDSVSIE